MIAQLDDLLGRKVVRKDERLVAAARVPLVVVGRRREIDVVGMKSIAAFLTPVRPDVGELRVRNRFIVVGRTWIRADDGAVQIGWPSL